MSAPPERSVPDPEPPGERDWIAYLIVAIIVSAEIAGVAIQLASR
jgi:hypothetical protein